MKRFFTFFFLIGFAFFGKAQDNFNMEMLSFIPFTETGNDIWGFVDADGLEYAVVGSRNATRIFSLEDPSNPMERAVIPGTSSLWRDIKSFGDYIYVTADEGSDGLLIIDMTQAPETITHKFWQPTLTMAGVTGQLGSCHNLYIDENGTCYLAGCRIPERDSRGIILVDITTDPLNPTELGYETNAYAHDVYAREDIMYTSDIYEGEFSIYDVSDKANPVYLGGAETSSLFTHNAWLSDDGNTLFTTDEVGNGYVDAYDISDLNDIRRLDLFQPQETVGSGVIPHNTHVLGDFLVTSWYTDGVVITDASRPDNLVKVGAYDTFLGPHGNFNGCWGVYPFLPSGLVIASNITNGPGDGNGGLYILRPTYKNASFLEGTVRDMETGDAVNMASVTIQNPTNTNTTSNPMGVFKTGIAETGTYDVVVSHPDYLSQTINVLLENGVVNVLNVELERKSAASISGSVVASVDGTIIPDADVFIYNDENSFSGKADANGTFNLDLFSGEYTVVAGSWGYLHKGEKITIDANEEVTIELEPGYQDDFIFDHNWTATGTASAGNWVKDVPLGTEFNGSMSNPGIDAADDYGMEAWVTGNSSTEPFVDDVDNGDVILTSPVMDLSGYDNPQFNFEYWFINDGGNSIPNDNITISLSNGTDRVDIFTSAVSEGSWQQVQDLEVDGLIDITDQMQIIVKTEDLQGTGHVVEAGFDAFLVRDGLANSSEEVSENDFEISPNPFADELNIYWSGDQTTARIFNSAGKLVQIDNIQRGMNRLNINPAIGSGVYFVKINDGTGAPRIEKIIKH